MENKFKFNVYPLSEDDGGGFYAEVPELPGCIASAQTIEETIKLLQEAIDSWVHVTHEKGKTVPNVTYYNMNETLPSGRFSVRISRSSHKKLLEIADRENESLNGIVSKFLNQMIAAETIDTVIAQKLKKNDTPVVKILPIQNKWEWDSKGKAPFDLKDDNNNYMTRGGKSA